MKKVLSMVLAALMSLTMMFGLTACGGGPTEEQSAKLEELMTRFETIMADCETEYDKLATLMEGQEGMDEVTQTMENVRKTAEDMRKSYDENKDSYDEEKADEVIALLETQIKNGENFLKSLKDANTDTVG